MASFEAADPLVVTLAAPYRCTRGFIHLANGRDWPVNEPTISPEAIAAAIPRRLVSFIAGSDEMLPAADVTLPVDLLSEGLERVTIEGATHAGLPADPSVLARIIEWLDPSLARRLI